MDLWLKLEVSKGSRIDRVADEISRISRSLDVGVEVVFNRIHVHADPESTPQSILATYNRQCRRRADLPEPGRGEGIPEAWMETI